MSDVLHLLKIDIKTLDDELQKKVYMTFYDFIYKDVYFILNDHGLAEDAIQIAFMKALDYAPKTRYRSNIFAWIKQVARNAAIDLIRKDKKHRQHIDLDAVYINKELALASEKSPNVENEVVELLKDEALYNVLELINEDYRTVLLLHYIHGLSYKEIQKELGVSRSVLASRLSRARKKMYEMFKSEWGE